jgi:hypothetical protein
MIKLFKIHDYRGKLLKVNYVDHTNRFAGFDLQQQCCESAEHWIENSDGVRIEPDYWGQFDYLVFTDNEPVVIDDAYNDYYRVTFKLIDTKTNKEYKLVFENCHNGWYSHGYEYGTINKSEGHI